jgi:hypothetical protein
MIVGETLSLILFLDDYYDKRSDSLKRWLVGAAGFTDNGAEKFLSIAGYIRSGRGKGLFGAAWPKFTERFGAFYVSYPRSSAMRGFLSIDRSVTHDAAVWKTAAN